LKKYRLFQYIALLKNITIIFYIFTTIATDSSLPCMTGKKDYKFGELTVL